MNTGIPYVRLLCGVPVKNSATVAIVATRFSDDEGVTLVWMIYCSTSLCQSVGDAANRMLTSH